MDEARTSDNRNRAKVCYNLAIGYYFDALRLAGSNLLARKPIYRGLQAAFTPLGETELAAEFGLLADNIEADTEFLLDGTADADNSTCHNPLQTSN
jgi:hypothetical protein